MNEHIKEMARQAGGIDMTNHAAGGITTWIGTGTSEFIEQFAELIVKECAAICDSLQDIPATEPRHCAEDIRIHFGVEK